MTTDSDIAIVGVGCRFPGADNLEEFWRVLGNAENHVKDIPAERWNIEAFLSEDKDAAGKMYVKKAGLLKNYDEWDPQLFGISETEAERIDPQQRHALECVYMALEDGGFTKSHISGSQTGVFIGAMNYDYQTICDRGHEDDTTFSATGQSATILSARISYVFDLRGPCLTLDTACSSSLMAIHLGSQAILMGDCDMAVCGGVSMIMSPGSFVPLCRARMMSAEGQCQTFCNTADGYARGEGCGIVILKKLSQAMKDEDKIWAVVKTGTNQDGRAVQPITAPSTEQQEQLLEMTYAKHGIDPSSIQYIEAHGTGTLKGDSAEVNALGRFFSKHRNLASKACQPLRIGSVKTNIGHTESAAGVAGVIKTLLMMKHGQIIPSLHLLPDKSNINPDLQMDRYGLNVAVDFKEWKANKHGERFCCVSSFGFGGSNCHAIVIQKAIIKTNQNLHINQTKDPKFICLSAFDNEALQKTLLRFKQELNVTTETLSSISYTSTNHRNHFKYRLCFLANTLNELANKVSNATILDKGPKMETNIVFVYCGVGTSWTGMCSTLMNTDQVFRDSVKAVDKFLIPLADVSMAEKLADAKTEYNDPFFSHVAIFVTQVALTDMWRSLGISPDVIVGQSVGEVAAAYASGSIDLKDAVEIIYIRSKILARCASGTMMVVKNIDVKQVEEICNFFDQKVSVAVYSSPVACTLTGDVETMIKIKQHIQSFAKQRKTSITTIDLNVPCAYHSKSVEPYMVEIKEALKHLHPRERTISIVSTVSGDTASKNDFQTGEYWAQNVRLPVKFGTALTTAVKRDMKNIFLEVGPRPVLGAHFSDLFKQDHFFCFPSMKYHNELTTKCYTVKHLYELGLEVRWEHIYENKYPMSSVPRHYFNRVKQLYMPEQEKKRFQGLSPAESSSHKFVRRSLKKGFPYQVVINQISTPFVFDHSLSEKVLVPGATYIESALEIGQQTLKLPASYLEIQIKFENPLYPIQGMDLEIDCDVQKTERAVIISFTRGKRVTCTGKILKRRVFKQCHVELEAMKSSSRDFWTKSEIYEMLSRHNFKYGPLLSLIRCCWSSETDCLAEICLAESHMQELTSLHLHPAVIDTVFQLFCIFMGKSVTGRQLYPRGVASLVYNRKALQKIYCYAALTKMTHVQGHINALLVCPDGSVICEMKDVYFQEVRESLETQMPLEYSLEWCLPSKAKVVLADINVSSPRKSILCYGAEGHETLFKAICERYDIVHHSVLSLRDDSKISIRNSLDSLEEQYVHAVVYTAFIPEFQAGFEHAEIYNRSKTAFKNFANLIVTLQNCRNNVPVYVLTANTQNIQWEDTKQMNIYGSELWGLVRCCRLESSNKICLIDVNPMNCDGNVLCDIISESFDGEQEFVVSGSSVHVSRLKACQNYADCLRDIQLEPEDQACLKSVSPSCIREPVFHPLVGRQIKSCFSTEVYTMQLTEVVMHTGELFPTCSDMYDTKLRVWPERAKTGFQCLAVEGTGHTTENNRHRSKAYFCCPVLAATFVNVPKELTIDEVDLPQYAPGILMTFIVLYTIARSVVNQTSVCIIADHDESLQTLFLRHVLETDFHCSVSILKKCDFKSRTCYTNSEKNVMAVVLLSTVDARMVQEILNCFQNLRQIVTMTNVIPKEAYMFIKLELPILSITILQPAVCLEFENLITVFPLVKEKLKSFMKIKNVTSKCSPNDENKKTGWILSLPMNVLRIFPEVNKKDVYLRVDKTMLFRKQGCYVIVGGLTGLGWLILETIAELGGGYVVSISRRKPSEAKQKQIKKLMAYSGVTVRCVQTDITNLSGLQIAICNLQNDLKGVKIKGIFNGAGVLADCLLKDMTDEDIDKVMRPKILGSWNLHIVSKDLDLDYFVLHSSVVSILGNAGQCNYGAGNCFIDTLASYRKSLKLPAQSINWGALSLGMAQENDVIERNLRRKGIVLLSEEDIRNCFIAALLSNKVQVTFGKFDWQVIGKDSKDSKLHDIVPRGVLGHSKNVTETSNIDFDVYNELSEKDKFDFLVNQVTSLICQIVPGLNKTELTADTKTAEYLIESLDAVAFVNKLSQYTSAKIDVQLVHLDGTTIGHVADVLLNRISIGKSKPSDEFLHHPILKTDKNVSFMEEFVLLQHTRNPRNPALVRVIDLEIIKDVEFWRTAIRHVVTMNKELCKRYTFINNEVNAVYLSNDEVDVDCEVIPFESIGTTDVRHEMTFNLAEELPVKFRLAQSTRQTIIRMILHAVVTDLSSVTVIAHDLKYVSYALKNEMPIQMKDRLNVALIVHTKVNQNFPKLKLFWDEQIKLLSLCNDNKAYEAKERDENKCRYSAGDIPKDLVERAAKFVVSKGLTLFQLLASIYQLFVHRLTDSIITTVSTNVDLRIHVPELNGYVARCLNNVPLICDFRNNLTIEEFITTNASVIFSAVDNSAYPYSQILKDIPSETLRHQISRHRIVLDNMTDLNFFMNQNDANVRIKSLWHTRHEYHTFWYLYYDSQKKHLSYNFGYNANVFDDEIGKSLPLKLLSLLEECLCKPQEKCKPNRLSNSNSEKRKQQADVVNTAYGYTISHVKSNSTAVIVNKPDASDSLDYNSCMFPNDKRKQNTAKYHCTNVTSGKANIAIDYTETDLRTGYVLKQTRQGWVHKVRLSLKTQTTNGVHTYKLEWKKCGSSRLRRLSITAIKRIQLLPNINDFGLDGIIKFGVMSP